MCLGWILEWNHDDQAPAGNLALCRKSQVQIERIEIWSVSLYPTVIQCICTLDNRREFVTNSISRNLARLTLPPTPFSTLTLISIKKSCFFFEQLVSRYYFDINKLFVSMTKMLLIYFFRDETPAGECGLKKHDLITR